MRYLKLLLLLTVALTCANNVEARSGIIKKNRTTRTVQIYAYGISQDLSDSVVYVTPVAPINGATMLPHYMLQNRQYYSEQMKNFVETTFGTVHQTVGFVYGEKRKRVEKLFARSMKKYNKPKDGIHFSIKTFDYDTFHFKVPVIVEAETTEEY